MLDSPVSLPASNAAGTTAYDPSVAFQYPERHRGVRGEDRRRVAVVVADEHQFEVVRQADRVVAGTVDLEGDRGRCAVGGAPGGGERNVVERAAERPVGRRDRVVEVNRRVVVERPRIQVQVDRERVRHLERRPDGVVVDRRHRVAVRAVRRERIGGEDPEPGGEVPDVVPERELPGARGVGDEVLRPELVAVDPIEGHVRRDGVQLNPERVRPVAVNVRRQEPVQRDGAPDAAGVVVVRGQRAGDVPQAEVGDPHRCGALGITRGDRADAAGVHRREVRGVEVGERGSGRTQLPLDGPEPGGSRGGGGGYARRVRLRSLVGRTRATRTRRLGSREARERAHGDKNDDRNRERAPPKGVEHYAYARGMQATAAS